MPRFFFPSAFFLAFSLAGCTASVTPDIPVRGEPSLLSALQRMDVALHDHALEPRPLTDEEVLRVRERWLLMTGEASYASSLSSEPALWRAALTGHSLMVFEGVLSDARQPLDMHQAVTYLFQARTSLFDHETRWVPPAQVVPFDESTYRTAREAGLRFQVMDERVHVEEVLPDTPASKAEIAPGWQVVAFQPAGDTWQAVAPSSLEALVLALRSGHAHVSLRLKRDDGRLVTVRLEVPLTPQEDDTLEVETNTLEGSESLQALRLGIRFFYESGADGHGLAEHVREAWQAHPETDVVIVDLRQARGGSPEEVVELLGMMTEGGTIAHLHYREHERAIEDPSPHEYWHAPRLQVWVGPRTASAAEWLAVALRERGAMVMGWPTYGKGTLQRRVELDPGHWRERGVSRYGEVWVSMGWMSSHNRVSPHIDGVTLDWALPHPVEEPWGLRRDDRSIVVPDHTATASSWPAIPLPLLQDLHENLHPLTPDEEGLRWWWLAAEEAERVRP